MRSTLSWRSDVAVGATTRILEKKTKKQNASALRRTLILHALQSECSYMPPIVRLTPRVY